jgi:hypothetical protein
MNSIAQMMCEKSRVSKAKSPEEISTQHPAPSMNGGGWTIPAAAHIWALNGFREEIDMGHEGKRLS